MAKEIELKLSVVNGNDSVLENIEACFNRLGIEMALERKSLQNIYFDTPEKLLNQYRMALRIRKKGDAYIQTLKTKGRSVEGLSERGEWEWSRPDASLDLALLEDLDVWPTNTNLSSLKAVFETNFVRHQAVVSWQGSDIELAFDQGEVMAAGKSLPILELELELKSGELEGLKSLASELGSELELTPSDISKAERGYSLLKED